MTDLHRIERLTFAMEIAQEIDAEPLQDRLSRFAARRLKALLEESFADDKATVLEIDHLTLDLGDIPEDDLERVLETRLCEALGLAVEQARHDPARRHAGGSAPGRLPDGTGKPNHLKAPDEAASFAAGTGTSLRDLQFYLMHGRYPAAVKPGALDLAQLLSETLTRDPGTVINMLAQLRHHPGVVMRLSHVMERALHQALVQAAQAGGRADLERTLMTLPQTRLNPEVASGTSLPDIRRARDAGSDGSAISGPHYPRHQRPAPAPSDPLEPTQQNPVVRADTDHDVTPDHSTAQTAALSARDWALRLNHPEFSPQRIHASHSAALKDQLRSSSFRQLLNAALTRQGTDALHLLLLPDLAGFAHMVLLLADGAEGELKEQIEQASLIALAQDHIHWDATDWTFFVLEQASLQGDGKTILRRVTDLAQEKAHHQDRFSTVVQVLEALEENDIHATPPSGPESFRSPAQADAPASQPDPLPTSALEHAREIVRILQRPQGFESDALAERIRLATASPQGLIQLREILRSQDPDLIKTIIPHERTTQILTAMFSAADGAKDPKLATDMVLAGLLVWADQERQQGLRIDDSLAARIAPFLTTLAEVSGRPLSELAQQVSATLRNIPGGAPAQTGANAPEGGYGSDDGAAIQKTRPNPVSFRQSPDKAQPASQAVPTAQNWPPVLTREERQVLLSILDQMQAESSAGSGAGAISPKPARYTPLPPENAGVQRSSEPTISISHASRMDPPDFPPAPDAIQANQSQSAPDEDSSGRMPEDPGPQNQARDSPALTDWPILHPSAQSEQGILSAAGHEPDHAADPKSGHDSHAPIRAPQASPNASSDPEHVSSTSTDPEDDLSGLVALLHEAGFTVPRQALSYVLGNGAVMHDKNQAQEDRFARLAKAIGVSQDTLARRLARMVPQGLATLASVLDLPSLLPQATEAARDTVDPPVASLSTRTSRADMGGMRNPGNEHEPANGPSGQRARTDGAGNPEMPQKDRLQRNAQAGIISQPAAPDDPHGIRHQIIHALTGAGLNMDHATLSRLVCDADQTTGQVLPDRFANLIAALAARLGMAQEDLASRLNSTLAPTPPSPELAVLLNPKPSRKPDIATPEEIPFHTSMAGLALVHLFLPTFLERSGCLDGNALALPRNADRAAHLIAQLATGTTQNPEHDITLPKLLAGLAPEDPVSPGFVSNPDEDALADDLLRHVASQVSGLQNTTPDVLRDTFLMRHGQIGRDHPDAPLTLRVVKGPFDMLLEGVPWSYSLIKLPWMREALHVEWT